MRRFSTAGWVVLGLAVLAAAAVVTIGALGAHGAAQFDRWAGWATAAAVPVAAVGVLLVLWDKIAQGRESSERSDVEIEDELAAVVLGQARVARSRLIGTDEPGDRAANIGFVKSSGRFREVGGAAAGDLGSVLEYFRSLTPQRMVVLGEPGAGKTVLALELVLRLLECRDEYRGPVPVLVSAAAYDTSRRWEDWLAEHLAQRFSMALRGAARLVRDGRVLPVVDGLDEMDAPGIPLRARALIAELNAWMRARERAPVAVTSRREEYEALGRGVDRATHVEMLPLTGNEAAGYLGDQFLDDHERGRWQPVVAGLRDDPGGLLAGQLATPWRLTLAMTVFRDSGDPAELLPQIPGPDSAALAAYSLRVDRLLLNGYVPAAVRLHAPDGRYRPEQVQRWLTVLAEGLASQARHDRSAIDLRLDQWWRIVGQRAVRIAHVALVALAVSPWLVAAAILDNVDFALIGCIAAKRGTYCRQDAGAQTPFNPSIDDAARYASACARALVRPRARARVRTRVRALVRSQGRARARDRGRGRDRAHGRVRVQARRCLASGSRAARHHPSRRMVRTRNRAYGRTCVRVRVRLPDRTRIGARTWAHIRARVGARGPRPGLDPLPGQYRDCLLPRHRADATRDVPELGAPSRSAEGVRCRISVPPPPTPGLAHLASRRDRGYGVIGGLVGLRLARTVVSGPSAALDRAAANGLST